MTTATSTPVVPLADRLWKIRDVAGYLGVPVSAVYKMTAPRATTRIPHLRIAGRLRFRRTDIDRWLDLLAVTDVPQLIRVRSRIAKLTGVPRGVDPQKEAA